HQDGQATSAAVSDCGTTAPHVCERWCCGTTLPRSPLRNAMKWCCGTMGVALQHHTS
ncbi:hypothetical protein PanWU01x14_335670, partial [Parasponia andersonii]